MKVSADVADSPASFQPLNAQTSAGARSPSGRRSQRRGCIGSTVPRPLRRPVLGCRRPAARPPSPACAPETPVDAVFACSRKDRLTARSGTPYLALELRDKTGAIQARAFRDADVLAGRFERGDLVRVVGRVERFRDELQLEVRDIPRAEQADPAAFLPVAYRDLDELEGFLEHLAREVHDPALPRAAASACSPTPRCAPSGGGPVHPRRAPRVPRRAARAHRRGRHARARVRAAAPASESGPAADRGARARPRQDPRVHLRRRDRPDRRGPAARPRRARPAAARRATSCPTTAGSRSPTACSPTTGRSAPGGRFGSAEALALYRLNALDASVKGALEHGLPIGNC